jgi:hypothetical protein
MKRPDLAATPTKALLLSSLSRTWTRTVNPAPFLCLAAIFFFTVTPCFAQTAQTVSPLYLSGIQFGGGLPNTNRIKVVQGASVIDAWDTYGSTLASPVQEAALAVSSSVKTIGGTICSGSLSCFDTLYSAEYALNGAFVGSTTLSGVPPSKSIPD